MQWGLIGASTIAAEWMIDAIRAQTGHEIGALLTSDEARAAAYAERHGIGASYVDLDALLGDIDLDAVYISTTNEKHRPQALAAIAAGKHVLCEKPLAMSVAEAREMVAAAAARRVTFATNHHLRCAGSHIAIRELISAGRIGQVLSLRVFHAVELPEHLRGWRIKDASAGGGVIPDITVHDADTVRFYLDEDPLEVVARAGASGLGDGVEDSVMSVWSMPSGVMVQSHESFTHPYAHTGIEVHGTRGSIVARDVMTQRPVGEITLSNADGDRAIEYSPHNLYEHAVAAFAAAVAGEGRPAADGEDGVKSLAVALAVRAAAASGKAVKVDYGQDA